MTLCDDLNGGIQDGKVGVKTIVKTFASGKGPSYRDKRHDLIFQGVVLKPLLSSSASLKLLHRPLRFLKSQFSSSAALKP